MTDALKEAIEVLQTLAESDQEIVVRAILGRPAERIADAGEEIDVAETRGVLGFMHVTRVRLALLRSQSESRTLPDEG